MKYAKAISPDSTKATGRVKRPSSSSRPPNNSSTPATPLSDINSVGDDLGAGKLSNFCVPCNMKRNALTMRRRLSR